jgi:dTDP-4-amino-4,6-dideoxygalactose transaminase
VAEARIRNARQLDEGLRSLWEFVRVPRRPAGYREVYQLYLVSVAKAKRDQLRTFLEQRGIETKIHYPIPLHLQVAAAGLGYTRGNFPVCEQQADEILTLPAHQHITPAQVAYMIEAIHDFYAKGSDVSSTVRQAVG